ncbi:hypothetical protein [Piscibacillus salipiscarius]|uniref:Uncharacterized protein n=1 Tax=Piscibacillus salipiscarius TaxID=299480 RepID=A0ABW5Q9P8_9BACI|nr:hypothetical protein [Piscibacillus salipiscarius]
MENKKIVKFEEEGQNSILKNLDKIEKLLIENYNLSVVNNNELEILNTKLEKVSDETQRISKFLNIDRGDVE